MTQNDVLLEWQLPLQLARNCGADERQITYFDAEEQVTSGPDVGKCTSSSTDMLQNCRIWRMFIEFVFMT